MKLTDYAKFNEGLELTAYRDQFGKWTIGYGHTGPEVVEGMTITKAEAEALLDADASKVMASVVGVVGREAWEGLNEVRRIVLCDMCFQMGPLGLSKFSRTLAAVKDGRWDVAASSMLASLWAKQTPNRARRNAAMMLLGTPTF